MKLSKRLIAVVVLLIIFVGGGAYLYFPRENASAAVAATLAILNTDITAQRSGAGDFSAALDGDIYKTGDAVKSSQNGRAVLTFFDGSTLTIDPGSVVKVTTLNRLDNGGIQLTIEQSLGRSWASVQKLKTPDSRFEVRTPTSTASVRGTAFVTNVTQQPDGTLRVSFEADDGQLIVSAAAGGTTTVNANQGVTVDTNQQAPANSTPLPPQPSLRVTSSANTGFALTGPNGGTCGSAGNKTEIFGCLQNGNTITIRNPDAGRYGVLMTAAAAANGTLTVEALRGTTVEGTRTFTRSFNLGDLVRTAFVYGTGTPLTVAAFDPAELVTSVCGAVGTGTVFSSGTFQDRINAVTRFGQSNHNTAVAFVATEQELNDELARQLAASPTLPVSNAHITVSTAGLAFTAAVNSPIGTITASGGASMGPSGGKIAIRVRDLSAGPVPQPVLDQLAGTIEKSAAPISDAMPFNVQQVALRTGCFAIMGTTP